MVTPGTADDARLETYREAADRAKKGEGSPVRIRLGGVNATTHVKSEMLSNGKAQGGVLVPGVVHKVPGVDCIITSFRQTMLDTTLEPEEFSATVVGTIEPNSYPGAMRDVDLRRAPLQDGVEEGFHMRLAIDDKD